MSTHITVRPNVARLAEGLRDTGYDLNMAVADLVDNAVSAGATSIDIRMGLRDDGEPILGVGDNGCGMNRDEIINAMRYGSDAREDALSKFGLGLKTASTAFCRRLVVVSRKDAEPVRAVWDLDHLAASGEWELQVDSPNTEELEYLDLCTGTGPGTAVIWERIDRMLSSETDPSSVENKEDDSTPARLGRLVKSLAEHLATVFQRFLNPYDDRARNLRISLNNEPLFPRDPFCGHITSPRETHILTIERNGVLMPITVAATILPRPEELAEEDRAYADISTKRQGIYVYRENRLIHGPDWLGIFPTEPHLALLRVSLSFEAGLDDVFMVDIKKSRVLVSEQLYMWLKNTLLPNLMKRAEEEWRKGAARVEQSGTRHHIADAAIAERVKSLRCAEVLSAFPDKHEVKLRNNNGTTVLEVRIAEEEARHITTAVELPHDQLFVPTILNGQPAVTLNASHPFYTRVYQANKDNSPLVQSLDFLFFCLAQAELNNMSAQDAKHFASARLELSKNLRDLVQILPGE